MTDCSTSNFDGTCSRRTIVQVHSHAGFLGTLASEDKDSCLTEKLQLSLNNLFALGIEGFDIDNIPISHADVTKLDSEFISREDNTNEFEIISIE